MGQPSTASTSSSTLSPSSSQGPNSRRHASAKASWTLGVRPSAEGRGTQPRRGSTGSWALKGAGPLTIKPMDSRGARAWSHPRSPSTACHAPGLLHLKHQRAQELHQADVELPHTLRRRRQRPKDHADGPPDTLSAVFDRAAPLGSERTRPKPNSPRSAPDRAHHDAEQRNGQDCRSDAALGSAPSACLSPALLPRLLICLPGLEAVGVGHQQL